MPHDSGLMVRQKHVTGTPGTYACIVLRHDVNLQRHYTCKNATYMWRYYDWLNPQCGATYDAEGPCGVIMSVEILRGLRYIEEDQNSWICSDPENLRKRNTYVCIPRQFRDYVCTIYVWNQNHPTGREEWIDHWRSFPFFTVYIIILVYVLHFNLYYPVLPLRISSLFKTVSG